MPASTKRRHKVFVSRDIQGRLIARICLYWFAYHVVLWHAMFAYFYLRQTVGLTSMQPQGTMFQLYGRFAIENTSLVLCALSVAPLVLWDALQVTHRIVGPLVRVQSILKQLARGEKVNRVALRDGDLLTELRDAFNEYLAASGKSMNQGPATDLSPSAADTSDEDLLLAGVQQLGELASTELVEVSHALADDEELSARTPVLHG